MLYVKLVEELAVKLPSWEVLSLNKIPPTVPELIDSLYRDLEKVVRMISNFGSWRPGARVRAM